jgi:hypothetical protein
MKICINWLLCAYYNMRGYIPSWSPRSVAISIQLKWALSRLVACANVYIDGGGLLV